MFFLQAVFYTLSFINMIICINHTGSMKRLGFSTLSNYWERFKFLQLMYLTDSFKL